MADALSRRMQFAAINTIQIAEWDDLETEIDQDATLKKILQDLLTYKD